MRSVPRPRLGAVLVAVSALLIGFSLTGCPDKKVKDPTCKGDKDCKAGLVCVENKCVQCNADGDCEKGERCSANACVTAPECSREDQCPTGQVCQAGSCKACATTADCGPGGTCDAGACKRPTACTPDAQCADDEDCVGDLCQKPFGTGDTDPQACPLTTVYFAFDDAGIAASERDRLDANAECIKKTPAKTVLVIGNTDTSGTEEYNIALSERRAQSVADYLARLGIDPAALQVVPKGETTPSGMGDDQDRRVEFQRN